VLVYAAVLADAFARDPKLAVLTAVLGGAGLMLLAFMLVLGWQGSLAAALLLLGGAYAGAVVAHGASVDERAPLVAVGLLLCGELASWSLEERIHVVAEPGVVRARFVAVASLCAGALAASALVVAVAGAPTVRGLAPTAVGAVAAVVVVALAVRLARH
jgi:hypothetical protein